MRTIIKQFRAQFYQPSIPVQHLSKYRLSEKQIAHLWGTETRHPPLFEVPVHSHDLPSFYLVVEGSLTEVTNKTCQDFHAGTVVFTEPGEVHYNRFHSAGGSCFLVELQSQWTERLRNSTIDFRSALFRDDRELTWLTARLHREFHHEDNVSPLAVEGLALEILGTLSRQTAEPLKFCPKWLHDAKQLLHDRFSETVKLDEIAKVVGVHPVHLSRAFRQFHSCSIGDYQRRLRVDRASRLLKQTDLSLVQIALSTGFSDQAHFSRIFKKLTGLTPAAFREDS